MDLLMSRYGATITVELVSEMTAEYMDRLSHMGEDDAAERD